MILTSVSTMFCCYNFLQKHYYKNRLVPLSKANRRVYNIICVKFKLKMK